MVFPDPQGYEDWVSALESGSKKAADIVYGFFFSDEYINQWKSNTAIVTDFYHAMMNRAPEPGGLAYWTKRLDIGMSMQVLNHGFVFGQRIGQVPDRRPVARVIAPEIRIDLKLCGHTVPGNQGIGPADHRRMRTVSRFRIAQCFPQQLRGEQRRFKSYRT